MTSSAFTEQRGPLVVDLRFEETAHGHRYYLSAGGGEIVLELAVTGPAFDDGTLYAENRERGGAFVAAVAEWLGIELPPLPTGELPPLERASLTYARMADDWLKLFLEQRQRYVELHMHIVEDGAYAELSGDNNTDGEVVTVLRTWLRDGPAVRRTPATDALIGSSRPMVTRIQRFPHGPEVSEGVWLNRAFVTPVADSDLQTALVAWRETRPGEPIAAVAGRVVALTASPDGERLAAIVARAGDGECEIILIESDGRQRVVFAGEQAQTGSLGESDKLVWHPGGEFLAFGCDETRIVAVASGALIVDEPRYGGPMQWDRDGLLLGSVETISHDGFLIYRASRWQAPDGAVREERPIRLWTPDQAFSVTVGESQLTIGQPGGRERVIEFARPEDREALGRVTDPLYEAKVSWLGPRCLILEGNATMALDVETGQLGYVFPDDDTTFVSASPDGTLVIGLRHQPDEVVLGQVSPAHAGDRAALAHPQSGDIERSLNALLAEDADYVIIEVRGTGAFVQFGADESLVLDVPVDALNPQQRARARAAFANLGVTTPTRYTDSDGSSGESYTYDCGRDPAAAAQVALDVLRVVYEPRSNASLTIQT